MEINLIFSIAVLFLSIIVHEVSHGFAALFLGDPTAKYAKRLTLNPISHIDPLGSILVPILTSLIPGSFVFGWAKPVPFNPYNLRWKKWGEAFVAFAGPLSNILIALVASFAFRLSQSGYFDLGASAGLLLIIVIVNISLAVFNLMPIPPLDGSKIFFALLPLRFYKVREVLERHAFLYVLIFIFVIWRFLEPIIPFVFSLMTGVAL
jgi:Zn-dependent protease